MPTDDHAERMLGNAELGRLLGVTRQRVSQIVSGPDFPRPRFTLIMGSVWALDDVQEWANRKGRSLHLDALGSGIEN
jgi:predicted DNA-binding transcriptional regulator AlpA